jgi:hypothetical protein
MYHGSGTRKGRPRAPGDEARELDAKPTAIAAFESVTRREHPFRFFLFFFLGGATVALPEFVGT